LFEFVATIDYSPYFCVPAAIEFRQKICGGEKVIRKYCYELVRVGGQRVAECLNTEVMTNQSGSLTECCFANVKLPFTFREHNTFMDTDSKDPFGSAGIGKILKWLNITAVKEFHTYLQIGYHSGFMWVRLSGQTYLELNDFIWLGPRLAELCARVQKGEFKDGRLPTEVHSTIDLDSMPSMY
jgi:hypothetical protein